MNCPTCQHPTSKVIDSRADILLVRRRRSCLACRQRWTTYEMDTNYIQKLQGKDSESEMEDIIGLLEAAVTLARRKNALPTGIHARLTHRTPEPEAIAHS
jgi:transcriptional regulator NrdR family protein